VPRLVRYARLVVSPDLERLRRAAAAVPGARLVVLFGSVARGQAAAWSDADIGILGLDFWPALKLGAAVASQLGREPHVVDLDRASDWLRFRVANEGVPLCEGEPGAWAGFRATAPLRYFDVQPIIARCAAGARRRLLALE